jgi:uncharacterized membrane protein YqgA involved in biofilm formation
MHLWGYMVNTIAVLVGAGIGYLAGAHLSDSLKKIILTGLGLSTILIGAQMALASTKIILIVGSLVSGGIIGQLIGIEEWLEKIGERLRERFERPVGEEIAGAQSTFVLGFVTASLLFCTGPMTIVGSLQDGFAHQGELIYIKSIMDGMAAIALTASMGMGVFFSAIVVFVVQGALTYAGVAAGGAINRVIIDQIGAAGGALILGIGFNLLGIAKIRVGNFLPALLIAALLAWWFL